MITTDGTTLLGADDKAGIAEIMTAMERIITEQIPHGKICIGFTPDEEIGAGADHFDVAHFGADYAYTLDGDLKETSNTKTLMLPEQRLWCMATMCIREVQKISW